MRNLEFVEGGSDSRHLTRSFVPHQTEGSWLSSQVRCGEKHVPGESEVITSNSIKVSRIKSCGKRQKY